MKARSLLILVGLPIMALISGPIFATDAKTFPDALCQPPLGASVIRDQGGLFNNGDVLHQVWTCPIVRDNTVANTNGILSAFVIDENPFISGLGIFEEVFCTLNSNTKTGSTFDSATASTSGSNPAAQQLNFTNIDASEDGYYYLSCFIPKKVNGKRSGILMYKVEEK